MPLHIKTEIFGGCCRRLCRHRRLLSHTISPNHPKTPRFNLFFSYCFEMYYFLWSVVCINRFSMYCILWWTFFCFQSISLLLYSLTLTAPSKMLKNMSFVLKFKFSFNSTSLRYITVRCCDFLPCFKKLYNFNGIL